MPQRYNAFLIRLWSLGEEQGERAELTHLQSGQRARVASLTEALDRIKAMEADGGTAGAAPKPAAYADGEAD